MDMTGYLGKKVDIKCNSATFSGYIFDILEADDSSIGEDSIELSLIDKEAVVEIAISDIIDITVDPRFKEFPVIKS